MTLGPCLGDGLNYDEAVDVMVVGQNSQGLEEGCDGLVRIDPDDGLWAPPPHSLQTENEIISAKYHYEWQHGMVDMPYATEGFGFNDHEQHNSQGRGAGAIANHVYLWGGFIYQVENYNPVRDAATLFHVDVALQLQSQERPPALPLQFGLVRATVILTTSLPASGDFIDDSQYKNIRNDTAFYNLNLSDSLAFDIPADSNQRVYANVYIDYLWTTVNTLTPLLNLTPVPRILSVTKALP